MTISPAVAALHVRTAVVLIASCNDHAVENQPTRPPPAPMPSIRVSFNARAAYISREYRRPSVTAPWTLVDSFLTVAPFQFATDWGQCCGFDWYDDNQYKFHCWVYGGEWSFEYKGRLSKDEYKLTYLNFRYFIYEHEITDKDTLSKESIYHFATNFPLDLSESGPNIRMWQGKGVTLDSLQLIQWGERDYSKSGYPLLHLRYDSLTNYIFDDSSRLTIEFNIQP